MLIVAISNFGAVMSVMRMRDAGTQLLFLELRSLNNLVAAVLISFRNEVRKIRHAFHHGERRRFSSYFEMVVV